MREITVGYFHYGDYPIDRFVASIEKVYGVTPLNCYFPCKPEHAMAARAQAYSELRGTVRGKLILCDADVEAIKPIEEWPLHIGLTRTLEATPLMPFNGGMILASDTADAMKFLHDVKMASNIVPQDFQYLWYIDQLALGYVAKNNPVVVPLPESYNYIPRFDGDRPNVHFIHYKGKRKSWS